ncbi:MAG: beta-eliminating lyase-related protein [Vicinamibacteria bacterium]
MAEISRRAFVEAGALLAAAAGAPAPADGPERGPDVRMTGDGPELTPAETVALLAARVGAAGFVADEYGLGGAAEELERYFAGVLGKERALFFPTGTLANHVALRTLAGARRRVIVQDVSHVYNDTGDSAQALSGLNLVPLAPGRATFTWDDVQKLLDRTASGRVRSDVGVLSIESPVRRLRGELFDRAELERVAGKARAAGLRLHLDGARLFMASAYTGLTPAAYAAPFDTVYVSLWKYFGAPNGAILAGPADVIDGLFHVRRAFGGALWSVWPFAAVARQLADGFVERLRRAIAVSEAFVDALAGAQPLAVERIANGTNVLGVRLLRGDPDAFAARLLRDGIAVPHAAADPAGPTFWLRVNETWSRREPVWLANAFRRAAGLR